MEQYFRRKGRATLTLIVRHIENFTAPVIPGAIANAAGAASFDNKANARLS